MDDFSNDGQSSDNNGSQPQNNDTNDLQARIQAVRTRAQAALMALLPNAQSLSAEKRFELYINDLHDTSNPASAEAALEAALAIEDTNRQADALAEIIDEVDYYNLAQQSI